MAWEPDYATVADAKSYIRVDDAVDDAEIALAITAASRAVDRSCNRQFGLVDVSTARFYTAVRGPRRGNRWMIEIDDLMDTTGLEVAADLDDDDTYSHIVESVALQPVNAAADNRPFKRIVVHPSSDVQPNGLENGVRVTGLFGWEAVPSAIQNATLLQVARLIERRDAPFGVAGSPETGSEVRLLAKLDVDVEVMIAPYRRWWAAV